ncbi:MAG: M48 family metallopeptidase [Elusimicrobia bacterium]|nr:M48 family metallopeptidase [Elusimicrobiota bacterium]
MDNIYTLSLSDNNTINIFIIRKKIKNYYMKIAPDLTVEVSIPLKMDINVIYDFINSHKKWIEKSINKFKKAKQDNIKDALINGGTVKILDSQYIVYIYSSNENKIIFDGFTINIYSKMPNDTDYLQKQYNEFLKAEAYEYFKKVLNKYLPIFQKYNVPNPTIKIKPLKSKWGSCRISTGEITLNLHLFKASAQCIDYVILHELTHLVHPGHKKRFYNFLEKYMPNYREIEKQLDTEAAQLLY